MSGMTLGVVFLALLLVLMALRVPIAVAMLMVGAAGYVALAGWQPLLSYLKTAAYGRYAVYDLSVVPLFLLMGNFASRGGMSRALFMAAEAFLGHRRGGVAMAAIGACAGFGAICGSSLATAATMGQVALPELRRLNYHPGLATATLAAGGTLGILIPPSVVLVIYAILTEQNIAKLFLAAFVPGVIAALGYIFAITAYVHLYPAAGPRGNRKSAAERRRAVVTVWPVATIFMVVVGGIYGGVFTPTEAAAVGTAGTGITAMARGMRFSGMMECFYGTAEATGMIFLILIGADLLNVFLALTQLPANFASWVSASGMAPLAILGAVVLLYLLLGCVMDSLSMILLTIPILYPAIQGLDFWGLAATDKAIWFGMIVLSVVEIGLITPPVGMNVYIINNLARDVPMAVTFRGMVPFLISDGLRVVLLVFAPGISLGMVYLFS